MSPGGTHLRWKTASSQTAVSRKRADLPSLPIPRFNQKNDIAGCPPAWGHPWGLILAVSRGLQEAGVALPALAQCGTYVW